MAYKCRVLKCGECEITQWYGGSNNHLGLDIVGKGYTLDTIVAHSAGTVCFVQTGQVNNPGSTGNASYGNFVKIDHGNGYATLYAHLDKIYVTNGQKITKGQEIGYMGNTGNSYGAHLHFEVWKGDNRTDPYPYLNTDLAVVTVTPTVTRDETKDQLKVNVDDLRVRKAPATNQAIVGVAKLNGIYNYYETKEAGGYIWYRIADNQWIANSDNWCTIYPKKDDKSTIEELKAQIKQLEKDKQELADKCSLLEKENKILKEENNEYEIFSADESDLYGINLVQGETIKFKRV